MAKTNVRSFAGQKKVLAMDDDEAIRKLLSWGLPRLGYEVVTAADGEEAITLFRQAKEAGQPFAAVIIDLTVKGPLSGREVMSRLREIDSGVLSVVSSGHAGAPAMRSHVDHDFDEALPKPYTLADLGRVLGKLLRER